MLHQPSWRKQKKEKGARSKGYLSPRAAGPASLFAGSCTLYSKQHLSFYLGTHPTTPESSVHRCCVDLCMWWAFQGEGTEAKGSPSPARQLKSLQQREHYARFWNQGGWGQIQQRTKPWRPVQVMVCCGSVDQVSGGWKIFQGDTRKRKRCRNSHCLLTGKVKFFQSRFSSILRWGSVRPDQLHWAVSCRDHMREGEEQECKRRSPQSSTCVWGCIPSCCPVTSSKSLLSFWVYPLTVLILSLAKGHSMGLANKHSRLWCGALRLACSLEHSEWLLNFKQITIIGWVLIFISLSFSLSYTDFLKLSQNLFHWWLFCSHWALPHNNMTIEPETEQWNQ